MTTTDPITADLYTSWTRRQGNHADCSGLGLRVVPEPLVDLPCHCDCHRGLADNEREEQDWGNAISKITRP